MARFLNWLSSLLINFMINIFKSGPIPKHIAIIMDGNRRYGRKQKISLHEAYTKGFESLTNSVKWFDKLGVNEITVYAFSMDNFKRTEAEVTLLMDLFEEKFTDYLNEESIIMRKKVRVKIFGKLSALPTRVQTAASKLVIATKENNSSILNICLAYSGREEITNAFQLIVNDIQSQTLSKEEINEKLISQYMYSNGTSNNPEILIRTSGEVRLSDFLLWQTSFTSLYMIDILWPEWNIWSFLFNILIDYQRNQKQLRILYS
ncbi:dehydrodolichyl diphosphate synthase complex subunit DHDDS-like [Chrysoperla carnea]|uniref:dehydrodolichyl diphosphate synthase complex subunit DHDDS-like n=1 Tax=Chrysoperla carnea TaxID=189513 RepID=UPI001D0618A3|nr:dehydrodolichyl diphosphate synthase complex subunit DHDDS-like [Chrysoperla carnea]